MALLSSNRYPTTLPIMLLPILLTVLSLAARTEATGPYLDVHLRIQPADDFCGARTCDITYALSVLNANNQYDLQSMMLQEGQMRQRVPDASRPAIFEDSTVIRLTSELRIMGGKIYLGLMLFDLPDDIQDYYVIEVTDAIRKEGRKVKVEFSSETARLWVRVHKEGGYPRAHQHHHASGLTKLRRQESAISTTVLHGSAVQLLQPIGKEVGEGKCSCALRNCGCCEYMLVPKIHLNDTACVNISYISEDIGVRLTLSVDQHVYISRELSLRNPPPVCFEMPHLREYASLCARLYNVEVGRDAVSACSEIDAKLYHVTIARVNLGCFRIPL